MFRTDCDVEACCKEICLPLAGEADETVHSHGSSSTCFEDEKPFCTFRDRSGDFVATALSFLAHSACPVTPVCRQLHLSLQAAILGPCEFHIQSKHILPQPEPRSPRRDIPASRAPHSYTEDFSFVHTLISAI